MTNEQAIKVLLDEWKCIDRNDGINCDRQCEKCDLVMDSAILKDAYNMAIQALEKENIYDDGEHYVTISKALYDKLNIDYDALSQEPCDDVVSRQAVMDCFKKWQPYMATRIWSFEQELSNLPSVTTMCDATPEEQKSVNDYIKSISTPTGVKFDDAISRKWLLDSKRTVYITDRFDGRTSAYISKKTVEDAPFVGRKFPMSFL